jgi:hypothetical protein
VDGHKLSAANFRNQQYSLHRTMQDKGGDAGSR